MQEGKIKHKIVIITGTPGTGKSRVAKVLAGHMNCKYIALNELAGKEVHIKDVYKKVKKMVEGGAVIESHFSHLLGIGDVVVVLRTDPRVLRRRLVKKGFDEKKIVENLEAEALDACLIESVERHKFVYEVDTSRKGVDETVGDILKIVGGDTDEYKPGRIDWSEEYFCNLSSSPS